MSTTEKPAAPEVARELESTAAAKRPEVFFLGCALVFAGAAALRLAGIFTDFWQDEIWSWMFVQQASSPLAIFTEIQHDNNHWLNSLFLYYLGTQPYWYVYRLLSLVTGTGSVILAGLIGRRYGRLESFLALVLVGFSYLLLYFSSEARGYAPLVFFALLCFYLMQQQVSSCTGMRSVLFSASAILGILSHLTFLFVFAAMLLWSVVVFIRQRRSWSRAIALLLTHYALPLAVLVPLYFINVRHMYLSVGSVRPLRAVLQETVVVILGSPDSAWAALLIALFTALAVLLELWMSRDRYNAEWIFFAAVLVLPFVPLIIHVRQDLYARYFLAGIPFLLILLSRFLARCFRGGIGVQFVGAVLVFAFLLGNGRQVADFLRYGRGRYCDAVAYMVEHTPAGVMTVGSNHDSRIPMVLYFYLSNYFPAKEAHYVTQSQWSTDVPLWFVSHSKVKDTSPPRDFVGPNQVGYTLQASFQAGAADAYWFIYRADTVR